MPANYYISPFHPPEWSGKTRVNIDPESYEKALIKDWGAEIVVKDLSSDTIVLSWDIIEKTGHVLHGSLYMGLKIVSANGSIRGMAEFAVWHRANYSGSESLYFFDEGLATIIEVNGETKVDDIVNAIDLSIGNDPSV